METIQEQPTEKEIIYIRSTYTDSSKRSHYKYYYKNHDILKEYMKLYRRERRKTPEFREKENQNQKAYRLRQKEKKLKEAELKKELTKETSETSTTITI
jgi:hypothetical protein